MRRAVLYVVAAIIWGVPGVAITIKGIKAYVGQSSVDVWWLALITVCVLVMFYLIFSRVVKKYSHHIASQNEKCHIWNTFSLRGWVLIIFMMGLGMAIKYIPAIPSQFVASFYSGLGPMLILSAVKFLYNMKINCLTR